MGKQNQPYLEDESEYVTGFAKTRHIANFAKIAIASQMGSVSLLLSAIQV